MEISQSTRQAVRVPKRHISIVLLLWSLVFVFLFSCRQQKMWHHSQTRDVKYQSGEELGMIGRLSRDTQTRKAFGIQSEQVVDSPWDLEFVVFVQNAEIVGYGTEPSVGSDRKRSLHVRVKEEDSERKVSIGPYEQGDQFWVDGTGKSVKLSNPLPGAAYMTFLNTTNAAAKRFREKLGECESFSEVKTLIKSLGH